MVGLPSVENREKILRTLLAKEKVDEELDFKELATMTEGYTGSDLKVSTILLCCSLWMNFFFTSAFCFLGLSHLLTVTNCLM